MIYLINNIRQHERHFWNCLHSIASQEQIKRILEGYKGKIVKNRVCRLISTYPIILFLFLLVVQQYSYVLYWIQLQAILIYQ